MRFSVRGFIAVLTLAISSPLHATGLVCDVDVDGDVDRVDIGLIFAARNQPATGPDDPRDADGDGVITVLDGRACAAVCTLPGCAEPPQNTPPVADAGSDQTVDVGQVVTLNGSGSSDADGDSLTFRWEIIVSPSGSAAALSDPTAVMPSFVAEVPGDFVIALVVNDGTVDSPPDDVVIVTAPGNTPPVADAGPDQTVALGSTVQLDGTGSSDADGDTLTFFWTLSSLPPGSSAVLSDPTSPMPTLVADVAGNYVVELIVDDGQAGSLPDFVTITTDNTPPVADAGSDQTVAVNTTVMLNGAGSSDADGDPLTYSWSLTPPAGSTAVLSDPTAINPTFVADIAGTYIAQLIVNDGSVNSLPDTTTISTSNTQPVADAGVDQTVDVDTTVQLDGSGSFDVDGDALTYSWSFSVNPGTASLSDPGSVNPTFIPDVEGLYVVQLIVNDGSIDSDPDTATITVNVQPNTDPIANDDFASLNEDDFADIDVLANDTDADDDTLTILNFGAANDGTVQQIGNLLRYTPDPDFNGSDSFSYTIDDGNGGEDTATVSITILPVNDPPVANDDTAAAQEDTPVIVDALANDADVDGDTLTVLSVSQPPNGSVANNGADVTYTPDSNFAGIDTFTYTIDDGNGGQDSATVTVNVGGSNDAPMLDPIGDRTVDEGAALTFTATASDQDAGDTLTFSLDSGAPTTASIDPVTGVFSWTPDEADGPGTFDVTIRVTDDGTPQLNDSETITVTVNEVNNAPELEPIGDRTVDEGQAVTFTAVAADTDEPANTLTFSLDAGAPADASIDPVTGAFSWTTSDGDGGNDFTITVRVTDDGAPALDDFETITVTVNAINEPPVLDPIGDRTTDEGSELSFTATATDPDSGDTLTFSLDAGAPPGAAIDPTTGVFSWTPDEAAGPDSVTITVRVTDDGTPVLDDSETITITVNEVNEAPVLDPIGDQSVDEGAELSFTALASDVDEPANTLTFSLDAGAPPGAAIDPTTGVFSWTPDEADGPDSVTVTVRVTDDGTPALDAFETITITVNEINEAPVLDPIGDQTVDEETELTFTATASDPDLPANALTFSLDAGAPAGAAIDPTSGAFSWTPGADDGPGTLDITVRVTDDGTPALDDFETLTITVNDVNTAPTAEAGPDQNVLDIDTVQLDGSASTDPDADTLTYLWQLQTGPSGGAVNFSDNAIVNPTATFNVPGAYTILLTVDDGVESDTDTVLITVAAAPGISISNSSVAEGDAGTTSLDFTVTLSSSVDRVVTVDFATQDNTATVADNDYAAATGTVTFPANDTTPQIVSVTVNGDTDVEPNESLFVNLSAATNAVINTAQATGTITNDDAAGSITLSPVTLNLLTQESAPLSVVINNPAPVGGQIVDLAVDPAIVTIPPSVTIPEGLTSASVTVDAGDTEGTATITASASGFTSDTTTVNVGLRTMSLSLTSQLVGAGRTVDGTVTLSQAAGVGGVTVTLDVDDPTVASLNPVTVVIPAGQTTGSFQVTGVAEGSATISAVAAGFQTATIGVQVTASLITLPSDVNVPLGQTASVPVSIQPNPAPAGGVEVTLVSDNTSNVVVQTPTVTIPEGAFSANATVLGASVGPANVTASSPNFSSDTTLVNTTAEFNIVESDVNFSESFPSVSLTVVLTSDGNPVAAPSPITVLLAADDPGCVDVVASQVIDTGFANVTTPLLQYGGATPLPCTTTVTASDTSITPDTVTVTVNPSPTIAFFSLPFTVGAGLQDSGFLARLGEDQHGGITVRIESDDPTAVLVAPDNSTPGTPFIDVSLLNGQTDVSYTIQGVEGAAGSANLTVSAPGFTSETGVVNVSQPAVRIESLAASIDTFDPVDPFFMRVGVANGSNTNLATLQEARVGGGGLTVTVTSSNGTAGELETTTTTATNVTVAIPEGAQFSATSVAAGGVAFVPRQEGATIVSASIPGFVQTDAAVQNVNVTGPGISLFSLPLTVGAGLQDSGYLARLGASQHGGVVLRLESSDPSIVLLAPDANTVGTGFVEFSLNNGQTDASYTIQGVEGAVGTATITATATGFASQTGDVTVVPPALRLEGVLTSIDTLDPDDAFFARVGTPNAGSTNLQQLQEARVGGGGLTVTLTNSNAAAGELVTLAGAGQTRTVTIPEGVAFSPTTVATGGVAFSPGGIGQTTIAGSIPGFVQVDQATQDVNVTAPGITLFSLPFDVGAGLQDSGYLARLNASQHGGVTMRVQSSDPSILLIAPDASTPGTEFIDVFIANGATDVSYTIQGVEGTTGTATITASATGFISGTGEVNIVQPALRIEGLLNAIDTLDPDDPFFVRLGTPNATNTTLQQLQEVRVGSGPLTVTINNSVGTVGELITNAGPGQAVTVQIAEGTQFSASTVAAGGVAFSPITTGDTTVTASATGFLSTDAAVQPVSVNSPGITLFALPFTVGAGLQDSGFLARLDASQHGGVTLRLESSNTAAVLLSPDATSVGAGFIETFIPNGQTDVSYTIQGVQGDESTVTITASAPGFLDETGAVTVVQAAFRLEGLGATQTGLIADDFFVRLGTPNASNTNLQQLQEARVGGGGYTATISNLDTRVASIFTTTEAGSSITVSIPEGSQFSPTTLASGGSRFAGLTDGVTTVSALIPGLIDTTAATVGISVSGGYAIPIGETALTSLPGTFATSSSDFSSGFVAANGIDLTNNSSWCTANNDPAPSLTVDYASDVTVTSIQMFNSQFDPAFSFLTGVYRLLDSGGSEIYNSGTVAMTNGGINLPVSPAVTGARTLVFEGVTWNSIEPCLSELSAIGTSP